MIEKTYEFNVIGNYWNNQYFSFIYLNVLTISYFDERIDS